MSNRISTIIDFDSKGGVKSLSSLRTEIGKADTAFGKLKTAGKGAFDFAKANAVEFAAVAGTAMVAFAAKSVEAFQDTALEAGKFADATGTAVEDASRWIEVAGDIGIEADSLQAVFLRLNKAIGDGSPVVKQYGIDVAKTADGAVDVSATMLNAIKAINGIKDPTERAAAAQKLFGRSYAQAAELIFDSADNVAQKLGEVSDAKVIDDRELAKAREFRAAMDNLADAVQDVQLVIGEALVPAITDAAEGISGLDEGVRKLTGDQQGLGDAIGGGIKRILGQNDAMDAAVSRLWSADEATEELTDTTSEWDGSIDAVTTAIKSEEEALQEATAAAQAQNETLAALQAQTDALVSAKLALVGGDIAVREAQREATAAAAELTATIAAQGVASDETAAAVDAAAEAQLKAAQAATDYRVEQAEANGVTLSAQEKAGIFKQELERLAGQLSGPLRDAIRGYIAELDRIPTSKNTIITTSGGVINTTPSGAKKPGRASGGPVAPGDFREVLEGGRSELLQEGGRTYLLSAQNGKVVPLTGAAGSPGGPAIHIDTFIDQSGTSLDNVFRTASAFLQMMGPS